MNFSGLGSTVGDMVHSKNAKNYFSANSPFFLKYPNYLAGEAYEDYSGYDWYYAAEIYGKFGNGCEAHLRSRDPRNRSVLGKIRGQSGV